MRSSLRWRAASEVSMWSSRVFSAAPTRPISSEASASAAGTRSVMLPSPTSRGCAATRVAVAATARSGLSDPRITSAMIAASTSRPPVVTRPTVVRICVMVALTADSGSPAAITYDPGTRPENTR